MLKRLLLGALTALFLASQALAQSSVLPYWINSSGVKVPTGSGNPLPVSGTFSATLGGFAPATKGTPISVTTGGVTGSLPAGAVVVATNVGTTNGAYCELGASATTSGQYIAPNGGWFAFTVGANTQLTCITSTSTTTVNMVGGAGLPTGTGGGGGGSGGGGAVTIADGADVTQGALADAAASAGGTGSLSAKMRLMTTQLSGVATATNQTSGGQKTQVVDGSGNVQPSGDVAARAIFQKLTDGTNTGAVKAASTAPVAADPAAVVSISPNSKAGYEFEVANTPTVQNAAYSAGNAIGGKQSLSVFRASGGSGVLNNISVWSKGGSTVAMTLYIFNADPSSSTCTDKSAFSLNAADVAKLVAMSPPVLTPGVVGSGTTATSASQQLPVNVVNGDSTQILYVCAVVNASVTPASTTDLVFKVSGVAD